MKFVKKADYFYGYIKGLSMWPALLPGDMLRALPEKAENLEHGDVIVIKPFSSNPIVHRFMRIVYLSDRKPIIITAGDRSGRDSPRAVDGNILKVKGVLRLKKWFILPRVLFLHSGSIPLPVVRILNRIARKLLH